MYLEDSRPPYRIVRIGQRMELQEILPGDLPPSTDYIDREDFERLYRDNPRNFTGDAEMTASPETPPQQAAEAARTSTEKPYRIGDEAYLDDGNRYRIERIELDSVTLRTLGLDSRFVIAFRDMYVEDFERQLRGNIFNQEILNRTSNKAEPADTGVNHANAQARSPEPAAETRENEDRDNSLEEILAGLKQQRDEEERAALAQGRLPIGDARLSEAINRLERQIERERREGQAREPKPREMAVSSETLARGPETSAGKPVTLIGTKLGADGGTIELTLPTDTEVTARQKAEDSPEPTATETRPSWDEYPDIRANAAARIDETLWE
ncbi:MAG: hypothetical protein LBS53_15565, partial [Synergistaceae bacterium]|nr:hypothetical protein [Synergistaceae bacterium]